MQTMIKQCTVDDLTTLKKVGYDTFYETFHAQNKPENLDNYLKRAFTDEKLLAELNQPHSVFYFIYYKGQVAGYLKVNLYEAQSEPMGDEACEIERIYLLNQYQGLGLGKLLYDKALEIAKENGKQKIWLGVWEKNERAIAFYQRLGFIQTAAHSFYMGDEEQVDFIMEKKL